MNRERQLSDALHRLTDDLAPSSTSPDPARIRRLAAGGNPRSRERRRLIIPAALASCVVVAGVAIGATELAGLAGGGQSGNQRPALSRSGATSSGATSETSSTAGYPACESGDITVTYRGGGLETGSDFGTLNILNTGPSTCRLPAATVTITPIKASGRAIPTTGWNNKVHLGGYILGANGSVARGTRPGSRDRWAQILLSGNYRDDAAASNGLCPARAVVRPAAWRLRGYLNLTVKNIDLAPPAQRHGYSASLRACADPALQLGTVSISQQP